MDSWESLLEGCKKNDRSSQERLYRRLYPALFTLCKKFYADNHDIRTALNTGMLKVFQNISAFDVSRGDFFNWAYTIVRNAAITMLRSRKPDFFFEELKDDHTDYAGYEPFAAQDWDEKFFYLDALPPATRAVCSLFYLEGFSIREIAGALEMKEGTVKWHLNHCRTRLRQLFTKANP